MIRFLAALAVVAALVGPTRAQDYVCSDPGGCAARITRGGKLTSTTFRKGDMVSTEAGWVVSTEDGWKKVKTRDDGAKPAPPVPQSHPWWWPIPCGLAGCHLVAFPFPHVGPIGPVPSVIALVGL